MTQMRHHRFRHTTGFTLIELMIAMVLGMALVFAATAGFRVLSQAITKSNQLSIENNLLRVGMQMALDEADFWTTSDNPLDRTKQPMRAGGTASQPGIGFPDGNPGMPFTPFQNVKDVITGRNFIDTRPGLDEVASAPRGGWNPNPLARAAWDQRNWVRANYAEEASVSDFGYQYWGTFGIYENLDPLASWHHWYGGQILGLMDGLGFWGLFDYTSSNAFLIYHTNNPTQVPKMGAGGLSWGGCPLSLLQNDDWFGNNDGGDNTMKARIRTSNGGRYFMPGPLVATPVLSRKLTKIGYEGRDHNWDPAVIGEFLVNSGATEQALPRRPSFWPDVSSEVRRILEHGHFITTCMVNSVHPITGQKISVAFAVISTNLRGARQQRLPTIGWANPFSGPTLDYLQPNPIP